MPKKYIHQYSVKSLKLPPFTLRDYKIVNKILFDDIKKYGIKRPILISGRTILDGCMRWKAAKVLGMRTIPAVQLKDWDEYYQRYLVHA